MRAGPARRLAVLAAALSMLPAAQADEPVPAATATTTAIRVEVNLGDAERFDVVGTASPAELLRAIREVTGVAVMHGELPEAPVEVRVSGVRPVDAVDAVAAAAGLIVERSGQVLLVRKPRPLDRLRIDRREDGSYAMPDRFSYGVLPLLGDDDDMQAARRALTLLEHSPELSLAVAPDLSQKLARELNREAHAYRRLLDHAGAGTMAIPRTCDPDRVRVYVAKGQSQYLCEILFAAGERLVHLVYVLEAKERRIKRLIVFETAIGE